MSPRRRERFGSLKPIKLGDLPKRHTFFLNPYTEYRFTKCPQCDQPAKMRKRSFVIDINHTVMLNFNMTTRYCPACDLIIMHQDILEDYLVRICEMQGSPQLIGKDYLVLGTLDRDVFQRTTKTQEDMVENIYIFKDVVDFEVIPARWELPPDRDNEE